MVIAVAAVVVLGVHSCETQPPAPNQPPDTELTNIPPDSASVFALVTLHWDGGDFDGYIREYQYRYTTYYLSTVDSSVKDSVPTGWKSTTQTSLTLAFNSADTLNLQRFQVRAVDDQGNVDPTPATKVFYTRPTVPPSTEIEVPEDGQQFFVVDETSYWWKGIQLTYTGEDMDGEIEEYGWMVDGGDTTWTEDTTLYIPPEKFQPREGSHSISVFARDNTNIIEPEGPTVEVDLVRPEFSREILIIDETTESQLPYDVTQGRADAVVDSAVDAFYRDIFGTGVDEWDYDANEGIPSRDLLGQYQLVIWHADDRPATGLHDLPDHVDVIRDYLNVGGDFIMSGWRILRAFSQDFPRTFEEGSFVYDYLHIVYAEETSPIGDFTGAVGVGEHFSDVRVDSVKLQSAHPFYGSLGQINLMSREGQQASFAKYIYSYEGDNPSYRRAPCGLRYYGTSFNAVILGFPMYFILKQDAVTMGEEILSDLGYTKQ